MKKIQIPERPEQIRMNCEAFRLGVQKLKESAHPPSDEQVSSMFMELSQKTNEYRALMGEDYAKPLALSSEDQTSVKAIFDSLNCSNWNRKFGWVGQAKTPLNDEAHPCEMPAELYQGLKLRKQLKQDGGPPGGALTGINIEGVGAHGHFPKEICDISTVRQVKMNWNLISGHIPKQLNKIEFLEDLLMGGNKLSGTLHDESFSNLEYLTRINLSFNELKGNIPNVFDTCEQLVELDLSGNHLTGTIPSSLGHHRRLKVLKAYSNQLSGDLPDIFTSPILETINLNKNKFTGSLNVFSQHCINLQRLQISHNELNQPLPDNIGNLNQLKVIHLQHNKIPGPVPDSICDCIHMDMFNVSHNELTHRLPTLIGNWTNCRVFMLTGNDIKGPIPRSISKMINLKDFHIFANFPTDDVYMDRNFKEHTFDRVYRWGTAVGMDHVHWRDEEIWGAGGRWRGFHGREHGEQHNYGFFLSDEEKEEIRILKLKAKQSMQQVQVGENAFDDYGHESPHRRGGGVDGSMSIIDKDDRVFDPLTMSTLKLDGNLKVDHDPPLASLSTLHGTEPEVKNVDMETRMNRDLQRLGDDSLELAARRKQQENA